ncbi:hypothetical protein LTR08_009300 [Meristemomyces frigidus]|nr:hypothetical protein LTR08_009300 [Meristemomyces frigidus]
MRRSSLLLAFLASLATTLAQGTLTASLDYGTFAGAYSLKYNISYYQKIPFGAPPTGQNRFRAPQPPLPITNGTYNSTQTFDYCPQRTVNGTEDCLYLGLYGRPWSTGQPLRPVVVVFFGGAFIEGGGSFSIPPAGYPVLNASSANDFIFVYPNYRVNAFGFLPGKQIAEDAASDLNPGLLDQQAALQWTHSYIAHFGGDRTNVSIWGQSAGAGSVVAQVIANGGRTEPKLFTKALASSPFWPKTYAYAAPQAQAIYDALAALANCTGPHSLRCLKRVDVQTLRTAALAISGSHTSNTSSYTWAPVLDGAFLQRPLSIATARGEVNIDAGWGMYNLHEGENFIPPGLQNATDTGSPPFNASLASFEGWLKGYLPGLSAQNLQRAQHLYPSLGSAENLPVYNTTYVRAGLIYRDTVLACPALWMARASHSTAYLGEYTIAPARHGSDTIWWNQVNAIQQSGPADGLNHTLYAGYTGAFASFFQTGDPNAHKLTAASVPGVPALNPTGEEFVIESTGFANVGVARLEARCAFWRSVGGEIPI